MVFRRHNLTRTLLLGVLFLLGLGGLWGDPLHAQDETNPVGTLQQEAEVDSTGPSSSADLVSVNLRLAATPVPAGESVRAAAVLSVQDGWHVNAHRPTYDYLIGTALDWDPVADVAVDNVRYPSPKRFELDFAEDAIDVYQGTAPILFDVRPAPDAAPGDRSLTGRLRVQACNDRTCLQPSTVNATLSVPVAEATASPSPTGDPIFEEAGSAPTWGAVTSVLRQHGPLIAGGILAVGTVLFLVVYSWVAPATEEN